MRQAGSYIVSATIHAAGLALLAFAPGYLRPQSAVTSGGVEVGAMLNAVAASASSSQEVPAEFEVAEPLTVDTLPDSAFAPEQTRLPLQQEAAVDVAVQTLPVLEVRSRIRQSPLVDRPIPLPINNAELVAAALAEQAATPPSRPVAEPQRKPKQAKPEAPPSPEVSPPSRPSAEPQRLEQATVKPALPPRPVERPDRAAVEKTKPTPKRQTTDQPTAAPAEPSKSKSSSPSRTGGSSRTAGVDEYPRILPVNAQPEYPPDALQAGHEGRVLLAVLVSEQGKAARVRLLTSSGFQSLDESAAAAVRTWKFQPAERAGKPTPCWVKVPVNFRIDDSAN